MQPDPSRQKPKRRELMMASVPMAQDPVCGMMVDPLSAAGTYAHAGTTYYFCSPRCVERFRADPDGYLSGKYTQSMEEAPAKPGTEYICPMCPEVVSDKPAACPSCGMALEPRTVTMEEEVNPELVDMTRRFWVGLALALPVLVLAMADMIPGQPLQAVFSPRSSNWVQFVLATPVVGWVGWPFFQRGWASVVNRSLNMFTLIAMGTGAAYLASALATIAPGLFPEAFRSPAGDVPVYFEAAAVIIVLVALGQVMELRARRRTTGALKSPARVGAQDRAGRAQRQPGRGDPVGPGQHRRPSPHSSRRKSPGRR